jgi:hypothetical protein
MNWEIVSSTGEWAGAIAVVVTLFYLARQIRQSNQLGIAASEREFFDAWHDIVRNLGSDTAVGGIIQRGFLDYKSLQSEEKIVFHTRVAAVFNQADLARRLHDKDLISVDLVNGVLSVCLGVVLTKGGGEWWDEMGETFPIYDYFESHGRKLSHVGPLDELSPWIAGGT